MNQNAVTTKNSPGRAAAFGSVVGALLASTCCVLPLVLVTLGVSGAWLGSLSALDPYREYFAIVTILFLAAGFWQVYRTDRTHCDDNAHCESSLSGRVTKIALWSATVLVTSVLTIDWWAPLFY